MYYNNAIQMAFLVCPRTDRGSITYIFSSVSISRSMCNQQLLSRQKHYTNVPFKHVIITIIFLTMLLMTEVSSRHESFQEFTRFIWWM